MFTFIIFIIQSKQFMLDIAVILDLLIELFYCDQNPNSLDKTRTARILLRGWFSA